MLSLKVHCFDYILKEFDSFCEFPKDRANTLGCDAWMLGQSLGLAFGKALLMSGILSVLKYPVNNTEN